MILKTVITTIDALAIALFLWFGVESVKRKDGTHNVSFALSRYERERERIIPKKNFKA